MLKFMRGHLGKGILIVVVAGIALVFVLWGVFPETHRFGSGSLGSTEVASVGGERITLEQLNRVANREIENYRSMGMDLPPELQQNIRMGTLNSLVSGKLLLSEARRMGVMASDNEVQDQIKVIEAFQNPTTKAFDVNQYRAVLSSNGLSPSEFEANVRDELTHQRMQKFLQDRIRVTDLEVEREFRLVNEQRNIRFLRFTRDEAMKKLKVSSAEVESFLADKTKEQQVSSFYTQNNTRFNQPEKACARHILKLYPPGMADDQKKIVPKDFLALKPNAKNFADLARKHSEDPGSKAQGGDLDCFAKGVMDPAFEQAAFALRAGEVSAPVHSQFGWHYILLTKKEAAVSRSLDSVKREIADELIRRDRSEEIRKLNREAAEVAAKSWTSSSGAETGFFSSMDTQVPKIGRADEILKAAFEDGAAVQKGPQIFESQGAFIVAQVAGRKGPDMKKFEAEKEIHGRTLKQRKMQVFMPAWLENVKSRTKISMNQRLLENLR
jgi:peptidyl-prolyl cis-trans isomerase D